jgi:probable HAF family extracellular repeat protein
MRAQYEPRSFRLPRGVLHLEALEDRCLPSTYTLTDLGPGIAYGINDAGLVVGGGGRAFTWDSTHGRQDLQTLGVDGLSDAFAVSPQGLIVGDAPSDILGHPRHAFLNDHGTVTDLGTFGGALSAAQSVNDAGQVVGWAYTDDPFGDEHAFLWDSQNGLQDLGTLGGFASFAYGINSSGLVVGFSYTPDNAHAFVWDSTSGMRDIGSNGLESGAFGANDAGQVVGAQAVDSSNVHAFLYDGGILIDLGNLGHGVAAALAINDAGVIVGGADARDSWEEHGFVYANGVMTDLNDLVPAGSGLFIREAEAINNAGQIVGVARDRWSLNHAILLTPDDGFVPRGVAPAIFELRAAVPESAASVLTNQLLANAPQGRAPAQILVALPADVFVWQATDAAFTQIHHAQSPAPGRELQVDGLGLIVGIGEGQTE